MLLPSRRACRALVLAFLRATGGRPLLLPRIQPLGDLDEDELALRAEDEPRGGDLLDLPPAMAPLTRQLLLTRLILRMATDATPDQAARLAAELAKLLDSVQIERVSFERLSDLAPAEHAEHWQRTLRFLEILTGRWPGILAERGACDPAERRNRVIAAQAALWRERPPEAPVFAAGSTGSIPATAELLDVVARLPQGAVVLPGLDTELDEDSWRALDETHPQFGLARLLERLGAERGAVAAWEDGLERAPREEHQARLRARLLSEVMRPAATTDAWRRIDFDADRALAGIARVDAPGPEEEARTIALMLRESLEDEERTAALVTPDRDLARRVAAEVRRWGIEIDDSAGRPLGDTAPGTFLRLLALMAEEDAAPVPLLALLKHPLAAGGAPPGAFRAQARRLELLALRGPRPAPGLSGLREALEREAADARAEAPGRAQALRRAAAFVGRIERMLSPFLAAVRQPSVQAEALVRAHVGCAEKLAAARGERGPPRLWAGEAGEAAAAFVAELLAAAPALGRIAGRDYPGLFDSLIAGQVVRPRFGRHPRLAIWSPIEARLQHADHLILGGLNEGTWPPEPAADPWMSRPMRKAFGLPASERRIGLSAHDFAQAFGAPRVTLTRAQRVEGAPTVPCRWLLRLEAVLRAAGVEEGRIGGRLWLDWADALDRPAAVQRGEPPRPCPPAGVRPRELSVTQVETWIRDPYAIYARHILGLDPLDPLDADPGAAERGTIIHAALDRFFRAYPGALPADAVERLIEIGRDAFGPTLGRPGVEAFWWPRFERIARWVVERERERRDGSVRIATEVAGRVTFRAPGGDFVLRAKADRIDRRAGGLTVIDYKTGTLPAVKDVLAGAAPQLALEGAIASAGGFEGIPHGEVEDLVYWRLAGGEPAGEERRGGGRDGDPGVLVAEAWDGLESLIATFDDPATPYLAQPRPELAPRFSDYAHLARVKEWGAGDGGGE